MRVPDAAFTIRYDYERTVIDLLKKLSNVPRHIASDAHKDSVSLKMLQFTDVVTLALMCIDPALLHACHCTRVYWMPPQRFSLKTSAFDLEYVFVKKTLQARLHHRPPQNVATADA